MRDLSSIYQSQAEVFCLNQQLLIPVNNHLLAVKGFLSVVDNGRL
jgi:hypothetical protein